MKRVSEAEYILLLIFCLAAKKLYISLLFALFDCIILSHKTRICLKHNRRRYYDCLLLGLIIIFSKRDKRSWVFCMEMNGVFEIRASINIEFCVFHL